MIFRRLNGMEVLNSCKYSVIFILLQEVGRCLAV